jgi:hypothetical protein
MMDQFPDNIELSTLSAKLVSARDKLKQADAHYEDAETKMLPARVSVMFINYAADEGLKQAHRFAQLADGEQRGPYVTHLFPDGTNAITRLTGDSQVKEMRNLEGRYDGLISRWNDAQSEKAKVTQWRERYETALAFRSSALQAVHDARAARDLAKEDFLDTYAEVANRVRALFPRNRKKQDLFFDVVTERGNAETETEKEVA